MDVIKRERANSVCNAMKTKGINIVDFDEKMRFYFVDKVKEMLPFYRLHGETDEHLSTVQWATWAGTCLISIPALLLIYQMSEGKVGISEGIVVMGITGFVYLLIAYLVGGGRPYSIHGLGKGVEIIEDMHLTNADRTQIRDIYKKRMLPLFSSFFVGHKKTLRNRLWGAMKDDLNNNGITILTLHENPEAIIRENAEYWLLFWFMGLPLLFVIMLGYGGITFSATWRGFIGAATIDEFAKGICYLLVADLPNYIRVPKIGVILDRPVAKGVIAGAGYAFAENFMYLSANTDPVLTMIVRSISALPAHLISTPIFYMGMKYVRKGYDSKEWRDALPCILFFTVAILLHAGYNWIIWRVTP